MFNRPVWFFPLFLTVALPAASIRASGASTGALVAPHASPYSRAIRDENRRPGTTSWIIPPTVKNGVLAGYASAVSVNRGGSVQLYIADQAGAQAVTLDVYRMGWYGGDGARLLRRMPHVSVPLQPPCPEEPVRRTISCLQWKPVYRLTTGRSWLGGDYLIKLTDPLGNEGYIPLTVRDDGSHATFLVQNSVTTWQAYNSWGDISLYSNARVPPSEVHTQRALAVSFDRPYWNGHGAGDFLAYELSTISWLERHAFDVTYTTDVDVDLNPAAPLRHRALLVVGHDEYWSAAMRQAYDSARDRGVSLAFLGANDGYWQIRYESSTNGRDRTLVCYRQPGLDPLYGKDNVHVTTLWRSALLHRPENELIGIMSEGSIAHPAPFAVATRSWPYAGSPVSAGSVSPTAPVDVEFDAVTDNGATPSDLQVLAHSPLDVVGGRAAYASVFIAVFNLQLVGSPRTLSLTARTPDAMDIYLDTVTTQGTRYELRYSTQGPPPPWVDATGLHHLAASLSPKLDDHAWHQIELNPAADLTRLAGVTVDRVTALAIGGDADVAHVEVTIDGKTSPVVLTGPWRPVDPTTLPTVRTQTDPSVGPYESFRAPSAADTTIYRTQAGGYVFAAGFITWGEGLHGWGSAGTAWSVLDRLMSTVLRRMAGTD